MGVAPIAGRVSGTILSAVVDLAETVGSNRIRFTPYQKLIVLDLSDDRSTSWSPGSTRWGCRQHRRTGGEI
jgi:sulfite reductase beta subunit-like hemoprotein